MTDLSEYVKGVLLDNACPRPEKIELDDKLMEIGLDSLEDVQAILQFEDDLGIKISDEDYAAVRTVGEMIALVERKVRER